MNLFYRIRSKWTPGATGVVIFVCALFVTGFRTYQEFIIHKKANTKELINAAAVKKEALQAQLSEANVAAMLLSDLAAKHGVSVAFDDIATTLLQSKAIDMLGVLEGDTVTYLFPRKADDEAVRRDLFKAFPLTRSGWAAVATEGLVPFDSGVMVRRPFNAGGKLQGFAIAVFHPSRLFTSPGLDPEYVYQISKRDRKTGREIFFLPPGDFRKGSVTVRIPGGDWTIYVKKAHPDTLSTLLPFIFFSVLLSSMAGLITWYVGILPFELRKQVDEKSYLMDISERKYQSLFEQASDAILVHDLELNILQVNNAMVRMFGYSEEELLRMKSYELFNPTELRKEPLSVENVIGGEQVIKYRRMQRHDGSTIEVEANAKRITGERIIVIIRDVTEQRKAEKKIALSEATLRSAFEFSAIGMAIVSLEGTWVQVNRELCHMLGYTEEELLNLTIQDITHPDDIVDGLEFMKASRESTIERYHVEKRYIHKSGAIVWASIHSNVIKDENGKPLHFVTQIEDVTKKKESEVNFQLMIEKSLVGVYIVQDRKIVYANPRFAEMSGYTQEELTNSVSIIDLVHPDDLPFVEDQIKRRLEGENQKVHYEVKGLKKNGEMAWIEVMGFATMYRGAPAIIGTMQDVTERKAAADIILHEKNLSDSIINGLPGVFYVSARDGSMLRWNKNFETILRYDAKEIATMHITDFVRRDDVELAANTRADAFMRGKANCEINILTKDRQSLTYYITIMPISYNNEECILGIGIDYTEKKAAETALIARNEELRERTKELQCLFQLSEVSSDPAYSLQDVMDIFIRIIPTGYQFPEITCVKIRFRYDTYAWKNLVETPWKQEAPIIIDGQEMGMISVYYTEEKPTQAEGPFLAEERSLLDSVSDILSNALARRT